MTLTCTHCEYGDVKPGTACKLCGRVKLAEVEHLPVIPEPVLAGLERMIEGARAGRITQIVAVADDRVNGEYTIVHSTLNPWAMIGALEWAKSHPVLTGHPRSQADPGDDTQ